MKRNHFFITGLPRSRTAWLANFFTCGKSFCWHDASKRGPNAHGVIEELRRASCDYAGDADSGLLLFGKELQQLLPEARWLIVRRDLAHARESYEKYFRERPYAGISFEPAELKHIFDIAAQKLEDLRSGLKAGTFIECDFDDLDSKLVLEEAWRFLTPGNPWDALRCELLQELETNVRPEKIKLCPT